MSKNRNLEVDMMRGVIISLVVLGHVIQSIIPEPNKIFIVKFIYAFHMPFFIYISGYVARLSFDNKRLSLCGKVKTLLIPFLSWALIGYIFEYKNNGIIQYVLKLVKNVEYGLWFLWILFLLYVTIISFEKISKIISPNKSEFVFNVLNISWIFGMRFIFGFLNIDILGIDLYSWHYLWFLLGFYGYKAIDIFRKERIGIAFTLIYVILVLVWNMSGAPLFEKYIVAYIPNAGVKLLEFLYKLILPTIGIVTAHLNLQIFYSKANKVVNEVFVYLGQNTLEIYAVQFYFIFRVPGNVVISIYVSCILCIIMCIITSEIIKQSNLLRKILYAGRKSIFDQGLKIDKTL